MIRYKILSHTADLRLEIYGKTLEELFVNAAEALANIINRESRVVNRELKEKIQIKSENLNALLVDFLNEILAKSQINKAVYKVEKIVIASPDALAGAKQSYIEASLMGAKIDTFEEDVKAVTYYEADIKKENGFYKTRLVLDI